MVTYAVVPNIRGGEVGLHGDPRVPGLGGRAGVHRGLALGGVDSQQIVECGRKYTQIQMLFVISGADDEGGRSVTGQRKFI